MSIRKHPHLFFLLLVLFVWLVQGCDDMEDRNEPVGGGGNGSEPGTEEIYILCEGLFNLNNSTLAHHSFYNGTTVTDYFRQINRRGLGDTANDMAIYGDRLYIVVNVSSQIEVIDLYTGTSIGQVSLLSDNGSSRQPRYIAFEGNKAYVCCYDGTVARIDITSLTVESYIRVGRNPDGICVQNGKLYVSNSGGLDAQAQGVDRTVSVINISTFKEIQRIEVGPNPGPIRADEYGYVYVAIRGENIEKGEYQLVQIDAQTDAVTQVFDEKVLNFAVNDQLAYLSYTVSGTNESGIKVLNVHTGQIVRESFVTDGTVVHTPFSIQVNPFNGNVYLTDAYDYQVTGDVLCFNPQGELQFRIDNVGLNPNCVVFSDQASQSGGGSGTGTEKNPVYAQTVWEYVPAPGQFINTTTSAYREGYTYEEVLEYATERLQNRSLISLGGFGGYIVVGFDHTVPNVAGEYDLKVYGNAYYNMYSSGTGTLAGSSEPGIVMVAKDTNGNGLPDDEWYELAGSEYDSPDVIRNYEITYYRPDVANTHVYWTDSEGGEGYIYRSASHLQESYFPEWIATEEITFRGSRLPDNGINEGTNGRENWVSYCFPWGYADNHPNSTELCQFKIDWAVDRDGNPVHLDGIDFVKVYTAVNQHLGWTGEVSTEVQTIEDLHYKE